MLRLLILADDFTGALDTGVRFAARGIPTQVLTAKAHHFTEEDAEYIKQALLSLFENDQSSARPDGSMTVRNLYWFTHSNKLGNASSARVYDLVHFDEATDEFIVNEDKLSTYVQKGLKLDLIEGF